MSFSPGKKPIPFGKYLLLDRINIGGMAEVWRGKMTTEGGLERLVAIKRILPNIAEDRSFIGMFLDEARISVQLTHANVAQIYDLGQQGGTYFIAMEYIPGKDLRALFDRGRKMGEPSPIPMCCYVVAKAAEGLDHAHRKTDVAGAPMHVVHRDVSPQNVLLGFDGEIKIIDFGIAKAAGSISSTQAGILKGKFGYMSPEQSEGSSVDQRSDIFSLGICLYELLTGERLFSGESDMAVLEKVRMANVRAPSYHEPRIPDALDRIVLKSLAKDVAERYQHADELADDLQRFLITSNLPYGRKELTAFMKEAFTEDLEKEKERQAEYALIHPEKPKEVRPPAQGEWTGMTDPGSLQLSKAGTSRTQSVGSMPQGTLTHSVSAPMGAALMGLEEDGGNTTSNPAPELPEEAPTTLAAPLTAEPPSNEGLGQTVDERAERPGSHRRSFPSRTDSAGFERSFLAALHAASRRWYWVGAAVVASLILVGGALYAIRPRHGILVLELPPAAWGKSKVILDGVDQGDPRPVYAERLAAGIRTVAVSAPGFVPWQGTVDVHAGMEATVLQVPLQPIANTGQLSVLLFPDTAEVRVGGIRVKAEGTKQAKLLVPTSVGRETLVEVSAPGYRLFTMKVRPASEQTVRVSAKLEPLTFAVTVKSEPPKARVLKDGQLLGQTPLNVQLPFGSVRLTVEKRCFVNAAVNVEPGKSSEAREVQVRLQPVSGCRS